MMVNHWCGVALVAATIVSACSASPRSDRTPSGDVSNPARVEGRTRNGLAYSVEGAGSSVVLVHGFQTDMREWDEVAPILARSHRVIRYDARGHGQSAGFVEPSGATDDLQQLLDELGISHASVVGLSMGSEIALDFALAYPDRVDRVVMISPSVSGLRADVPTAWVVPIVAAIRANDRARAATLWWESPLLAGVRARGAAAERYREVVNHNTRIWNENPANRRPLDPPAVKRLEQLRAPLLVLTGDADARGFHQIADTLARRAPGAHAEVVAGAGHMVSMERPRELAERINSFLSGPRTTGK